MHFRFIENRVLCHKPRRARECNREENDRIIIVKKKKDVGYEKWSLCVSIKAALRSAQRRLRHFTDSSKHTYITGLCALRLKHSTDSRKDTYITGLCALCVWYSQQHCVRTPRLWKVQCSPDDVQCETELDIVGVWDEERQRKCSNESEYTFIGSNSVQYVENVSVYDTIYKRKVKEKEYFGDATCRSP